jgi:type IV secretory pathway protease TraF
MISQGVLVVKLLTELLVPPEGVAVCMLSTTIPAAAISISATTVTAMIGRPMAALLGCKALAACLENADLCD